MSDPDATTRAALRRLAGTITAQGRRIDQLERARRPAQLAYSSVEAGSIVHHDEHGVERHRDGQQPDGSYTSADRNAPPPVAPAALVVVGRPGALQVSWTGATADGSQWRADFLHVVVYQDGEPLTYLAWSGTVSVTADAGVVHEFTLTAVNTSGAESAPSVAVSGAATKIPTSELDVDLDSLGSTVYYGDTDPSQSNDIHVNDLWANPGADTDGDGQPDVTVQRWDGKQWVPFEDATATQAIEDAAQARTEAQQAQTDASQAITDAATAQATADEKIVTYYQATAPSVGSEGDIWYDTDTDRANRHDGTTWVGIQDTDIQQALSDAQGAQATADGKVTTFSGVSTPTAEGVGDIWLRDFGSEDFAVYRWDGSSWLSQDIGQYGIGYKQITETKIDDRAVTSPKLESNLVLTSQILARDYSSRTTFSVDGSTGDVRVAGTVEDIDYVEGEQGWHFDSLQSQVENLNALSSINADRVSTEHLDLAGDPVSGLLSERALGYVAHGQIDGTGTTTGNITGYKIVANLLAGALDPARAYLVHYKFSVTNDGIASGSVIDSRLHLTEDGSYPSVSMPLLNGAFNRGGISNGAFGPVFQGMTIYRPSTSTPNVNIGLAVQHLGAGTFCRVAHDSIEIGVLDLGRKGDLTGTIARRYVESGGGSDPEPTQRYTRTFDATWTQSFDGDGTRFAGGTPHAYQGYYSSTHGNTTSLIGFNDSAIRSFLAGGSDITVEAKFRCRHSYYNAGTYFHVHGHNHSAAPTSYSAGGQVAVTGQVPSGQTTTVDVSGIGAALRDGTAAGVGFKTGSTGPGEYGYAYGASSDNPPQLIINVTK